MFSGALISFLEDCLHLQKHEMVGTKWLVGQLQQDYSLMSHFHSLMGFINFLPIKRQATVRSQFIFMGKKNEITD